MDMIIEICEMMCINEWHMRNVSFFFLQCRNSGDSCVYVISPWLYYHYLINSLTCIGFNCHDFHTLYSLALAICFPFQVTSTWPVWPKACIAISQSLWPPGMAFRAVWLQWTWMGACQTSSMMPSIGVDKLSVAVKVQPFLFLSYILVASTKPLCCLCQCPFLGYQFCHFYLPSDIALPSVSSCHWLGMSGHVPWLQECMLADVFPVSHTCH